MDNRILLIEDEPGLVFTLSDLFAAEGYQIETAADGIAGFKKASEGTFAVIVLDVMLPGKNGFDICRELRSRKVETPILMLTARSTVQDRVAGLRMGADDYLPKPFEPSELLARVEALLRRAQPRPPVRVWNYRFADIQIDFEHGEVLRAGSRVEMTGKELQLLQYLVERRGSVISRDELLRNVWDYHESVSSRTVDVHIVWLRQKLEPNPQAPRHFQTVRGVGYRFTE